MLINVTVSSKEFQACHGVSPSGPCDTAMEVTGMDVITTPLAPPPLPPPPPPPPPPPSPGITQLHSMPRSKLRNLNWERIPKERVEGRPSVWSEPAAVEDDFAIDLRSLDELFSQREAPSVQKASSFRRSQRRRTLTQDGADKVSLLDAKRSMNVGIFLRQFKSPAREIVEDIRQGDGERYGAEKLSELCKLLPDREEEKRLRSFQGDRTLLGEPDLFMLLLVELPSFRLRLDAMILKQEFEPSVSSLCVGARQLGDAARELQNCSELHVILRLVLKAGNYMNAGSYAGNAAGFRIASLLKLADTKANKPGMNLLHFVAMEVMKKDPGLLSFSSQLEHVAEASRLSEESLQDDVSRLRDRLTELKASIQSEPEVQQQIQQFLEVAEKKLEAAEAETEALQNDRQALVDFFCEDEQSFKLEEACKVFHSFCQRFQKAVKENAERELKEQKQAERKSMERRRSVASCSGLDLDISEDSLERALEKTLISAQTRRSLRHTTSLGPYDSPRVETSPRKLGSGDSPKQQETCTAATQTQHGLSHQEGMNTAEKEMQHGLNTASTVGEHGLNSTYHQNGLSTHTSSSHYGPKSETLQSQCELSTVTKHSTDQVTTVKGTYNQQQESTHSINSENRLISDAAQSAQDFSKIRNNSVCAGLRQNKQLAESQPQNSVLPGDLQARAVETVSEPSTDSAQLLRLVSEKVLAQQMGSTPAAVLEVNNRRGSDTPERVPQLAEEAEPPRSGAARTYSRVGETLECLSLVRALHSYETITVPVQRAPPSHCSKWRKEVGDRERSVSQASKDDTRSAKYPLRVRKTQAPRPGTLVNANISKVRSKVDEAPVEDTFPAHGSRLPITRSNSGRSTIGQRPPSAQAQIKRASSTSNKARVLANQAVKANRNLPENATNEKDKAGATTAPFIRGSPMRVSKRLAPKAESHVAAAMLSPSSTTAKTIRTSIIAAAVAKEAKTSESASNRVLGSRLPGPKVARPAAQPMWR